MIRRKGSKCRIVEDTEGVVRSHIQSATTQSEQSFGTNPSYSCGYVAHVAAKLAVLIVYLGESAKEPTAATEPVIHDPMRITPANFDNISVDGR